MTGKARGSLLRDWFNLITENTDTLAHIMTAECGKPLSESRGEVAYAASFVEWYAEEAKRTYGEIIPATVGDKRLTVNDCSFLLSFVCRV